MTNDPVRVHADFARDRGIAYTLLADRGSEIIAAFGLIDERMTRGGPWYGIAHPITFVIDAEGVITHRFSGTSYRDRIAVDVVLSELRKRADG